MAGLPSSRRLCPPRALCFHPILPPPFFRLLPTASDAPIAQLQRFVFSLVIAALKRGEERSASSRRRCDTSEGKRDKKVFGRNFASEERKEARLKLAPSCCCVPWSPARLQLEIDKSHPLGGAGGFVLGLKKGGAATMSPTEELLMLMLKR